jgi:RNA polymerase sigma-B factor
LKNILKAILHTSNGTVPTGSQLAREAASPDFSRWETPDLLQEYARTKDLEIRNELLLRHERMVRFAAVRFGSSACNSVEDLVQVGYLGLISALERFDPEYGQTFSSFALPTIVGVIKHYLRDHSWLIKTPRRLRELATQIRRLRNRLEQRLGRAPTTAEIAAEAGVTEERLLQAMEVDEAYYPLSLDASFQESSESGDIPLQSSLGIADPAYTVIDEREVLRCALASLEEREREIIMARFWSEATQQQVADRLGISQMHVSRLERRALKRLREVLSTNPN